MAITEILLLILTIVFVILAGYLINLIIAATKTLEEAKKALSPLNEISLDLQKKISYLDPLFRAVSNLGEGLEMKTASLKEQHYWKCVSQNVNKEKSDDTVADLIEWALLGAGIWQKFKGRR